MNTNVTAVVPGDIIVRDDTDITVTAVEIIGDGGLPGQGATVRISGRITRGYGRSAKVHVWTYYADQEVDVDRGEERWVYTPAGRARRVR